MNINQFKDFKFNGRDINKLMYGGGVIWQKNPLSGKFVGYHPYEKRMLISDDLFNWTLFGATTGAPSYFSHIGDLLVENFHPIGDSISFKYSDDYGGSWKNGYNPHGNILASICHDGKLYYMLDVYGNIASSSDMITWTKIPTNLPPTNASNWQDRYCKIGYCKRYNLFICIHNKPSNSAYFTKDINNGMWTACPHGDNIVFDDDNAVYIAEEGSFAYKYNPDRNIFETIAQYNGVGNFTYSTRLLIHNGYLFVDSSSPMKTKIQVGSNWEKWKHTDMDGYPNSMVGVGNKVFFYIGTYDLKSGICEYDMSTGSFEIHYNIVGGKYIPHYYIHIK